MTFDEDAKKAQDAITGDPMNPKTFEESLHAIGSDQSGVVLLFVPDEDDDQMGTVAIGVHNLSLVQAVEMLLGTAQNLIDDSHLDITTFDEAGVAQ